MKTGLLLPMLFLARLASAQDVTGIWRGSFNSSERVFDMLNIEDKYKFEVQIEQLNGALNGVTYSYKTTVFYGKATANGTVNKKTGKVVLQEIKTVELKMQQNSYACIMTCFLQYTKNGEEEFLEGRYDSYGEKDSAKCGKGTVFLRKVATSDFHKEPFLVRRSIEQQQKEMLALNSTRKKAAPTAKKPLSNATAKTVRKPGTGNRPVPNITAKKPPVNKADSLALAKKIPPKPLPTVKKADPSSIAKKIPAKPNPPAKKTETALTTPKPSGNLSIPGIAKTDIGGTSIPETHKPISIPVPKVLASRENELVKTITISSREVVVNIYDNGTIDHDTISVYLDKKLVVSKQMLTVQPITVKLTLDDDNAYHELVMVAENMGDIPPNTSLMVVKLGEQNIEVRITSTDQKNAVVAFRYKKPA